MKGRVQSTRPVDLVVKRIFQCVKFSREKIFLLDLLKMMYNYLWKKLNTVKVQILSILYYINNLQILLNLNFARNFNFTRKGYSILWNSLLFFFKRWISKPKSVPRHFWARVYLRAHAIPMHPHLFFFGDQCIHAGRLRFWRSFIESNKFYSAAWWKRIMGWIHCHRGLWVSFWSRWFIRGTSAVLSRLRTDPPKHACIRDAGNIFTLS